MTSEFKTHSKGSSSISDGQKKLLDGTFYGERLFFNKHSFKSDGRSEGQEDKTHKYRNGLAVFVTVTITTLQ